MQFSRLCSLPCSDSLDSPRQASPSQLAIFILRFAVCYVASSPPITTYHWSPTTVHRPPPNGAIPGTTQRPSRQPPVTPERLVPERPQRESRSSCSRRAARSAIVRLSIRQTPRKRSLLL